jgi:hypothetical protein
MNSIIKPLEFNGKWDLSPSLESTVHISIKKQYDLFIDGEFTPPSSGNYFSSINPANEEKNYNDCSCK